MDLWAFPTHQTLLQHSRKWMVCILSTTSIGILCAVKFGSSVVSSHLLTGKYVGNRPIKLRKSTWKERTDVEALGRQKVLHVIHSSFSFSSCLTNQLSFVISRITFKRNQSCQRKVFCTNELQKLNHRM